MNGNMERSLHTEEHTVALVVEVQGGLIKPTITLAAKSSDTVKRVRITPQHDSPGHQELD